VRRADNLPPYCTVVTKSGNLNFLEPSGTLQACNGTDLPFYFCCNFVDTVYILHLATKCMKMFVAGESKYLFVTDTSACK